MLAHCSAAVDARGEIQGQAEFNVTAPCGQSCSLMLNQVGRWQPHRPAAPDGLAQPSPAALKQPSTPAGPEAPPRGAGARGAQKCAQRAPKRAKKRTVRKKSAQRANTRARRRGEPTADADEGAGGAEGAERQGQQARTRKGGAQVAALPRLGHPHHRSRRLPAQLLKGARLVAVPRKASLLNRYVRGTLIAGYIAGNNQTFHASITRPRRRLHRHRAGKST